MADGDDFDEPASTYKKELCRRPTSTYKKEKIDYAETMLSL